MLFFFFFFFIFFILDDGLDADDDMIQLPSLASHDFSISLISTCTRPILFQPLQLHFSLILLCQIASDYTFQLHKY